MTHHHGELEIKLPKSLKLGESVKFLKRRPALSSFGSRRGPECQTRIEIKCCEGLPRRLKVQYVHTYTRFSNSILRDLSQPNRYCLDGTKAGLTVALVLEKRLQLFGVSKDLPLLYLQSINNSKNTAAVYFL